MTRHTTFSFTLLPSREQEQSLRRHVGAARFAFNQCLRLVLSALDSKKEQPEARVPWSGFDLINAFNKVLKRIESKQENLAEIFEENYSVADKIDLILKITTGSETALKFTELFSSAASRAEIVVTFLALLELIRLKQLRCVQPEPFAEIEINRV